MERLYREHVLGEKPGAGLVQIGFGSPAASDIPLPIIKPAAPKQEEVGSMGD
jgi:hypothetical protein